jgi:hypothetical protein
LCVAAYIGAHLVPPRRGYIEESEMADIQRFGDEFQRASKDGFDASLRSFGEVNTGFQAIAAT